MRLVWMEMPRRCGETRARFGRASTDDGDAFAFFFVAAALLLPAPPAAAGGRADEQQGVGLGGLLGQVLWLCVARGERRCEPAHAI
mmetsp:Transcript_18260/g.59620  ORF Transcript_18260/g.59620 Transcript_18260/m.59620 type:complete len:86 (+) Transcript_18260:1739-1996(+)